MSNQSEDSQFGNFSEVDEENKKDDFDLFDDFIVNKEKERVEKKFEVLQQKLESSEEALQSYKEKCGKLYQDNSTLMKNISSLWKTACNQLLKQRTELQKLTKQNSNLVFSRGIKHVAKDDLDRIVSRIAGYDKEEFAEFLKTLSSQRCNCKGKSGAKTDAVVRRQNGLDINRMVRGNRIDISQSEDSQHLRRLLTGKAESITRHIRGKESDTRNVKNSNFLMKTTNSFCNTRDKGENNATSHNTNECKRSEVKLYTHRNRKYSVSKNSTENNSDRERVLCDLQINHSSGGTLESDTLLKNVSKPVDSETSSDNATVKKAILGSDKNTEYESVNQNMPETAVANATVMPAKSIYARNIFSLLKSASQFAQPSTQIECLSHPLSETESSKVKLHATDSSKIKLHETDSSKVKLHATDSSNSVLSELVCQEAQSAVTYSVEGCNDVHIDRCSVQGLHSKESSSEEELLHKSGYTKESYRECVEGNEHNSQNSSNIDVMKTYSSTVSREPFKKRFRDFVPAIAIPREALTACDLSALKIPKKMSVGVEYKPQSIIAHKQDTDSGASKDTLLRELSCLETNDNSQSGSEQKDQRDSSTPSKSSVHMGKENINRGRTGKVESLPCKSETQKPKKDSKDGRDTYRSKHSHNLVQKSSSLLRLKDRTKNFQRCYKESSCTRKSSRGVSGEMQSSHKRSSDRIDKNRDERMKMTGSERRRTVGEMEKIKDNSERIVNCDNSENKRKETTAEMAIRTSGIAHKKRHGESIEKCRDNGEDRIKSKNELNCDSISQNHEKIIHRARLSDRRKIGSGKRYKRDSKERNYKDYSREKSREDEISNRGISSKRVSSGVIKGDSDCLKNSSSDRLTNRFSGSPKNSLPSERVAKRDSRSPKNSLSSECVAKRDSRSPKKYLPSDGVTKRDSRSPMKSLPSDRVTKRGSRSPKKSLPSDRVTKRDPRSPMKSLSSDRVTKRDSRSPMKSLSSDRVTKRDSRSPKKSLPSDRMTKRDARSPMKSLSSDRVTKRDSRSPKKSLSSDRVTKRYSRSPKKSLSSDRVTKRDSRNLKKSLSSDRVTKRDSRNPKKSLSSDRVTKRDSRNPKKSLPSDRVEKRDSRSPKIKVKVAKYDRRKETYSTDNDSRRRTKRYDSKKDMKYPDHGRDIRKLIEAAREQRSRAIRYRSVSRQPSVNIYKDRRKRMNCKGHEPVYRSFDIMNRRQSMLSKPIRENCKTTDYIGGSCVQDKKDTIVRKPKLQMEEKEEGELTDGEEIVQTYQQPMSDSPSHNFTDDAVCTNDVYVSNSASFAETKITCDLTLKDGVGRSHASPNNDGKLIYGTNKDSELNQIDDSSDARQEVRHHDLVTKSAETQHGSNSDTRQNCDISTVDSKPYSCVSDTKDDVQLHSSVLSGIRSAKEMVCLQEEDTIDQIMEKNKLDSDVIHSDDSEFTLHCFLRNKRLEITPEKDSESLISFSPPPFVRPPELLQTNNENANDSFVSSTKKESIFSTGNVSSCSMIHALPLQPTLQLNLTAQLKSPLCYAALHHSETTPDTLVTSSCSPIPIATPLNPAGSITESATPPQLNTVLKSSTPIVFDLDRKPKFSQHSLPNLIEKVVTERAKLNVEKGVINQKGNKDNGMLVQRSTTKMVTSSTSEKGFNHIPVRSSSGSEDGIKGTADHPLCEASAGKPARKKVPFVTVSREVSVREADASFSFNQTRKESHFVSSFSKKIDDMEESVRGKQLNSDVAQRMLTNPESSQINDSNSYRNSQDCSCSDASSETSNSSDSTDSSSSSSSSSGSCSTCCTTNSSSQKSLSCNNNTSSSNTGALFHHLGLSLSPVKSSRSPVKKGNSPMSVTYRMKLPTSEKCLFSPRKNMPCHMASDAKPHTVTDKLLYPTISLSSPQFHGNMEKPNSTPEKVLSPSKNTADPVPSVSSCLVKYTPEKNIRVLSTNCITQQEIDSSSQSSTGKNLLSPSNKIQSSDLSSCPQGKTNNLLTGYAGSFMCDYSQGQQQHPPSQSQDSAVIENDISVVEKEQRIVGGDNSNFMRNLDNKISVSSERKKFHPTDTEDIHLINTAAFKKCESNYTENNSEAIAAKGSIQSSGLENDLANVNMSSHAKDSRDVLNCAECNSLDGRHKFSNYRQSENGNGFNYPSPIMISGHPPAAVVNDTHCADPSVASYCEETGADENSSTVRHLPSTVINNGDLSKDDIGTGCEVSSEILRTNMQVQNSSSIVSFQVRRRKFHKRLQISTPTSVLTADRSARYRSCNLDKSSPSSIVISVHCEDDKTPLEDEGSGVGDTTMRQEERAGVKRKVQDLDSDSVKEPEFDCEELTHRKTQLLVSSTDICQKMKVPENLGSHSTVSYQQFHNQTCHQKAMSNRNFSELSQTETRAAVLSTVQIKRMVKRRKTCLTAT